MPLCRDKTKRAPNGGHPFRPDGKRSIDERLGEPFEMILAVSLTRLNSRLTSKDSLVESLTINEVVLNMLKYHWMSMRTITSGSTHPALKSRALSRKGKMLYVRFALSQGATTSQLQSYHSY